MNIDKNKQSIKDSFYYTEGLQRQIPNSDSIKADLFVDSDWQGKQTRAGLWGVSSDNNDKVTAYPIIEFATSDEANHTGWRVWDGVLGGWTNLATPVKWNDWSTLAVTFDKATHKINLSLNAVVVASNSYDTATTHLSAAILNSKNYGPTTGSSYSVHWSNFGYGKVFETSAVPTNLRYTNPNLACGKTTNSYTATPT